MHFVKTGLLITVLLNSLFLAPAKAFSQATESAALNPTKLESDLDDVFEKAGAVAMAVAVIDNNALILQKTWGVTDFKSKTPITNDTLFRIGSISKMFTSLAALKLAEEGKLDLNAELSVLAPEIEYENAWKETHPILFAHLLEHTTGWDDSRLKEYAFTSPETLPLSESLHLFPESRKSRWAPGTRTSYCNTGPAVAAYIIEKITGVDFETYIQKHFFDPLSMDTATYFRPQTQDFAFTHIQQEKQNYWEVLYRPTGSINASLNEMTSFLKFMIHRGELGGNRLIKTSAIDRMEISRTSLGAAQGIATGYGLSNYTSGHMQRHTPFQGHNGGVIGGWSTLTYNSDLKSGFIIFTTGNPLVLYDAPKPIFEFLLRNHTASPTKIEVGNPEPYLGYYRSINPRNEQLKILSDLTAIYKISQEDDELLLTTAFGKNDSPLKYYANKQGTWTSRKSGLPTITKIDDPVVGEALRAGPYFLKPVSALSIWLPIALTMIFSLLNAISVWNIVITTPVQYIRKKLNKEKLKRQLIPFTCTAIFMMTLVLSSQGNASIFSLGVISPHSIAIFISSIGYAASSIFGLYLLHKIRYSSHKGFSYWQCQVHGYAHALVTLYLASYGLIGFRTWA